MRRDIKAIETRYKGYRFRSRLEARWAVFFDAMGVPWEYEKEGYDFSGSTGLYGQALRRYLPDFWLPTVQVWIEIKPCLPAETFLYTDDESLMQKLVDHTKAKAGFVFYGMPEEATFGSYCQPGEYPWRRIDQVSYIEWANIEDWDKLDDAMGAAKAARFEHGESGAR